MKLLDIICADFANFIFDYKVELTEFKNGELTIETEDKTFYNELLELVEAGDLALNTVSYRLDGTKFIITLS